MVESWTHRSEWLWIMQHSRLCRNGWLNQMKEIAHVFWDFTFKRIDHCYSCNCVFGSSHIFAHWRFFPFLGVISWWNCSLPPLMLEQGKVPISAWNRYSLQECFKKECNPCMPYLESTHLREFLNSRSWHLVHHVSHRRRRGSCSLTNKAEKKAHVPKLGRLYLEGSVLCYSTANSGSLGWRN